MANKELIGLLARAAAALETPADLNADEVTELAHDLRAQEHELIHANELPVTRQLTDGHGGGETPQVSLDNVGTHHLTVPHGPEGFLIAWHLFQGLKAQGASLEMQDGTFVAPEVLDAVLAGPDGFGDWRDTKFIIQLPDHARLIEKAAEYNAAQEAAAQATWALEEAHKNYTAAVAAFNEVRGLGHVQPGLSDYTGGMSTTVKKSLPLSFQPDSVLGNDVFPAIQKDRRTPWTKHGKEVSTVCDEADFHGSMCNLHRNTTPASALYAYLIGGGNGGPYGLTHVETEAFKAAYENKCIAIVTWPTLPNSYFDLQKQLKVEDGHNGHWFDDYVKYENAGWVPTPDLTPERAGELLTSFKNIQKETQGYSAAIFTPAQEQDQATLAASRIGIYEPDPSKQGWVLVDQAITGPWLTGDTIVQNISDHDLTWPDEYHVLDVALKVAVGSGRVVKVLLTDRVGLTDKPLPEKTNFSACPVGEFLDFSEFKTTVKPEGSEFVYHFTDPVRREAILEGIGLLRETTPAGPPATDEVGRDAKRIMANYLAEVINIDELKKAFSFHEGTPQEWGGKCRNSDQQEALTKTALVDIYHDIDRLDSEALERAYGMTAIEIDAAKMAHDGGVVVIVTELGAIATGIHVNDPDRDGTLGQYLCWVKK